MAAGGQVPAIEVDEAGVADGLHRMAIAASLGWAGLRAGENLARPVG
jgi:hypothetical protein